MRGSPADTDVVRTELRGKGGPVHLDYRLKAIGAGWKIYDVSVLGVWLAEDRGNSLVKASVRPGSTA